VLVAVIAVRFAELRERLRHGAAGHGARRLTAPG
jgi:hypothetical protein